MHAILFFMFFCIVAVVFWHMFREWIILAAGAFGVLLLVLGIGVAIAYKVNGDNERKVEQQARWDAQRTEEQCRIWAKRPADCPPRIRLSYDK